MRAAELNFNPSEHSDQNADQNVGTTERALSMIGGGFIALKGLRHGGLSGVLIALTGAALVKRGVTGHCSIKERFQNDGFTKFSFGQGGTHEAKPSDYFKHGVHVEEAVTIQAPAAQVYAFWRDFQNLARFMQHVKSVEVIDDKRSHWAVEGPAGKIVEWDAEIINEEEGRLISWKSLPGAQIDNTGTVQFREAPAGRGTEVRVVLEYLPPAGKLGLAIAKFFGKTPGVEVREDLRRLRQIIETGEVPSTEGQPRGEGKRGRVQTSMVEGMTRVIGNTDQTKPNKAARYARADDNQNDDNQSDNKQPDTPPGNRGKQRSQGQEPVGHAGDSSEEGGGE